MDELNVIQKIVVWALPVLFAITVHEAAHGFVAKLLGDKTALMLGRVTLNPMKHIDLIGTVLLPVLMLIVGGFVFGWAKPVPVTWENLRHPKRDMAIVALAGPLSNLLMALFWAMIIKLSIMLSGSVDWVARPLMYMGGAGIIINIILIVLNLLPIPPLDGGRILSGMLPKQIAWYFGRLEPYGLFVVIALFATGALGQILDPPLQFLERLLFSIAGL